MKVVGEERKVQGARGAPYELEEVTLPVLQTSVTNWVIILHTEWQFSAFRRKKKTTIFFFQGHVYSEQNTYKIMQTKKFPSDT